MKVFISWSGELSHKMALALRDWIPTVIQAAEAWCSSEDIPKGAHWPSELPRALEEASFGIICLTGDNVNEPWINFEAGALWKAFGGARLSPFLLGVSPEDLSPGPLAHFQATRCEKEDVRGLIRSINQACPTPLNEAQLTKAFEDRWAELERAMRPLQISSVQPPIRAGRRLAADRGSQVVQKAPKPDLSTLGLEDVSWKDGGSYRTVRGRLRNNGDRPVRSVRVAVDWTTNDGTVLDTKSTYAVTDPPLRPGSAKTWDMMFPYDSRMSGCRYYIVEAEVAN